MAYYNRDGCLLKLNRKEFQYFSSGQCAFVSHNNEIVFKEYFSDTLVNCRLSPDLFDILKDIDDEHFIKLFEIYSEMDLLELMHYIVNIRRFVVDSYTACYYSDDSVNALYENNDYILDNFNELEKLFDVFTDNSIITEDVKRENAILSHSGIVIIDPDAFYLSSLPKEDITVFNKQQLLCLFRSICVSGIGKIENRDDILRKVVLDLAEINIDSKTDLTYEIFKKLQYVKRPIEYLIK